MPKKSVKPDSPPPTAAQPARGSDEDTRQLFVAVMELMEGRDPYQINRVLDAAKVLFPSKLSAAPSPNASVGGMP